MSFSTITQTTPSQSLVDYKRNSTRNSTQATRLQTLRFHRPHAPRPPLLRDTALLAKFHDKGAPWARHEFDLVTKDFDVHPRLPPTYPQPALTFSPVHSRHPLLLFRLEPRNRLPSRQNPPKPLLGRLLAHQHTRLHLRDSAMALPKTPPVPRSQLLRDVVLARSSDMGTFLRQQVR